MFVSIFFIYLQSSSFFFLSMVAGPLCMYMYIHCHKACKIGYAFIEYLNK